MAKVNDRIKVSKEFNNILSFIRGQCLIKGQKPPTIEKITQVISKKINKEDLLHNEFIKI